MTALIYSFKDEKRKREIGKVLDERLGTPNYIISPDMEGSKQWLGVGEIKYNLDAYDTPLSPNDDKEIE
jgi:hypothetical protein